MYKILKAKYVSEKNHKKVVKLEKSFKNILRETKAKKNLVEKIYNNVFIEFEDKYGKLEIGTEKFLVFESLVKKSIRLFSALKESITTGDVAKFEPPLGSTPKKRKAIKGIPVFETDWKEFQYFINDDVKREAPQKENWKDFLKDADIDDDFKMELLKAKDEQGAYIKYMDYMIKLNKEKKKAKDEFYGDPQEKADITKINNEK